MDGPPAGRIKPRTEATVFTEPDEGSDGEQWCSASHFAAFSFYLEGVSEAEIDLHKVVGSPIGEHIASFAE